MEKQKVLVFVPTKEDKTEAAILCHKVIDIFEKHRPKDSVFHAFCLQKLIEGFEDATGIDIKTSISIEEA